MDQLGRFFAFDITLLTMFWYAAVIEVPRFLIGALYMAGREVLGFSPRTESISADGLAPRTPTISVLLPGHNEGAGLERTILGLQEQTTLPLQIVVIDDGSTDNMADVGRKLKARGLIDVFISTGLRGGKAAAQNLGLTYCKGDIIVVSDVDTSFDRDAIARLLERFADPLVGAVSGNLGVRNFSSTIVARFQAIQYLNSIAMGRRINDVLYGLFVASGAFAAFRREALESVGGWSAGPGEDGDVTTKLRRAGWSVTFQPHAWALTDVPETLTGLLRQRARWNRSFAMLRFRKHAHILNPLHSNFSLRDSLGTLDALYFEAIRPIAFPGVHGVAFLRSRRHGLAGRGDHSSSLHDWKFCSVCHGARGFGTLQPHWTVALCSGSNAVQQHRFATCYRLCLSHRTALAIRVSRRLPARPRARSSRSVLKSRVRLQSFINIVRHGHEANQKTTNRYSAKRDAQASKLVGSMDLFWTCRRIPDLDL
jgi:glycosyltransferase involved in cell wall biosynthesis